MTIERPMFPPQRDSQPIIDVVGVPEFFAEALARSDRIGPNRRLIFTVTQPDGEGGFERFAVLKLVVPAGTFAALAEVLLLDSPEPSVMGAMSLAVAN